MFDQEDSELNVAIGVVFGVIALVIALVIGMGMYQIRGNTRVAEPVATAAVAVPAPSGAGVAIPAVEYVDIAETGAALTVVYFDFAQSGLPASAGDALALVVAELAARPDASVLLSGFHDAAGSAEANAAVARERALAVRAALIDIGVPGERVLLRKPAETLGGSDAAEARRVEIRVQ